MNFNTGSIVVTDYFQNTEIHTVTHPDNSHQPWVLSYLSLRIYRCAIQVICFFPHVCGKLHMSRMEMNQNYLIGVDFDIKWDCQQIPKCCDLSYVRIRWLVFIEIEFIDIFGKALMGRV